MVHANGDDWLDQPSVFHRHQLLGVIPNHISVLSTSRTAYVSACDHTYSLCAVWVCHWKEGYSDVFSKWILRQILPFHGDRLYYCWSHCTHQLHMLGCFIPSPPWCSSAIIRTPQSPSPLLSLNWHLNISFSASYCLFCRRSTSKIGAPQCPSWPQLEVHQFHSQLFIYLPFWRCSAWIGCSAG
jgi:hypothetical protein